MPVLIQIDGYDPVAAAPVTLRAASVDDERVCHLDGQVWWPALASLPPLREVRFDGGFGGAIETPSSDFTLAVEPWPLFARYALADARVRIWVGDAGAAWAAWALRFDGRVTAQPGVADGIAQVSIMVDARWLAGPLLALYAGSGGAEGEAALKGQPKPLALGRPRYVPGVMIDAINSVIQLSAYGAIEDVEVAMERVVRFSASAGDYADHAALVAATIPAGQWATCKAEGKVRHGAPPIGLLSYHVKGDKAGPDGWARLPGSLIRRIALIGGGAGKIDEASLAALDVARPWPLSLYQGEQTTAGELIQRIAASVNAVARVNWLGMLVVDPIAFGPPGKVLDATGAALPAIISVEQAAVDAPWWRLAIGAEPTWAVHALSDVAFTATLVERGRYDPAETYREGHIVDLADGSRWVYMNSTPTSGNAPDFPGSIFWSSLSPTTDYTAIPGLNETLISAALPGQNVLYNGGFKLGLAEWEGGDWRYSRDWRGNIVQPPPGIGGVPVSTSRQAILVNNGGELVLSAFFSGSATVNAFLFVDIEWRNGSTGTLLGYSSDVTNGVLFRDEAGTRVRKVQPIVAPTATDGSGFLRGHVRLVSVSDVPFFADSRWVEQIKVERGTAVSAWSDEATSGADVAGATGRFNSGTYLPTNWNIGIKSLNLTGFALSDSDAGGSVTINIAATQYQLDDGRLINYPAGSVPGLAYGTIYFIWRNDPNFDGGTSFGASTDIRNATGTGKVYYGYFTTRASSGGTGGGGGGGVPLCVAHGMHVLTGGGAMLAEQISAGDHLRTLGADMRSLDWTPVESSAAHENQCVTIRTRLGAELTLATNTPCVTESGAWVMAANAWMARLPVLHHGELVWDDVVGVDPVGLRPVASIRCHNATYAAGAHPDLMILTHNAIGKP